MFTPNNRASNYMWQKLIELQGEIDKATIIVRDVNTPLSIRNRSSRQKISKDIAEFNNIINQLYIMNIYRLFHQTTPEYTFLSNSNGTFTKLQHIVG